MKSTLSHKHSPREVGAAAAEHTHTVADLPVATEAEALAGLSTTTLITPATLKYVMDQILLRIE